jgi:hypothetical protein
VKLGSWQLAARSVVFVDAQRERHHFLLTRRWDGASRLEARPAGLRGPHVCVLARSHVFRRRLHSRPATQRGLETLLRSAGEYFPAALQPATYGVIDEPGGAYLCALPRADAEALTSDLGEVQAVLVGGDAPEPRQILDTLDARQRLGRGADLAAQPARIVPLPAVAFAGALAGLAAAAAIGAGVVLATYPGAERLARELAEAEQAAGSAERQYDSIGKMLAAQRAVGEFRRAPGGAALDLVMAILDSAPAGYALTSVELKNGQLKLTGIGTAPQEWLGAHGVPPASVSTYRLQQTDRFTAQFPLPRSAPRGS